MNTRIALTASALSGFALLNTALAIDTSYGLLGMATWHNAPVNADGTGVIVGVVDTGCDVAHPAFPGATIVAAKNNTDTPYISAIVGVASTFGHGTHVTGTVLGRQIADAPGGPFKGIAPDAKVRVGLFAAAVADTEAITGAAMNPAVIVNHSYGVHPANAPVWAAAYTRDGSSATAIKLDEVASTRNVLNCVAAGNSNNPAVVQLAWQRTPTTPADQYNGLTVGSVAFNRGTARYQSWGRSLTGGATERQLVHLQCYGGAADGVEGIRAAHGVMWPGASPAAGTDRTWDDGNAPAAKWDIVEMSGTSMATPHVTGLAACMREYGVGHPALIREVGRAAADAYDHRVLKSVLMTGCDKPMDWTVGVSIGAPYFQALEPFDATRGTGVVNATAVYDIYRNGERNPGANPVENAWDIQRIGAGESKYYWFPAQAVTGNVFATLCWDRVWDAATKTFKALQNLDLELYVFNAAPGAGPWPMANIAYASYSPVDNSEHVVDTLNGEWVGLRVRHNGTMGVDPDIDYALSWTFTGQRVSYSQAPNFYPGWQNRMPDLLDSDGDGLLDLDDNCPQIANASQTDIDGDGIGDTCEAACPGDLDGDFDVDFDDLVLLLSEWGTGPSSADFDNSGTVDLSDLITVLANWGSC